VLQYTTQGEGKPRGTGTGWNTSALLGEKHECPSKVCLQVNRKNYVLIQQSIDIFENEKSHDYIPQESDNRVSLRT